MRCKRLNKTRLIILELMVNRPHIRGRDLIKGGAFITDLNMTMQNQNWTQQAAMLTEDFPEIFTGEFKCNFSMYSITLINDELARKLLTYQGGLL